MTRCGRLIQALCGQRDDGQRQTDDARTDDLIDEAERTRRELARITNRLSAHVIALRAFTQAYARHKEEPGRG